MQSHVPPHGELVQGSRPMWRSPARLRRIPDFRICAGSESSRRECRRQQRKSKSSHAFPLAWWPREWFPLTRPKHSKAADSLAQRRELAQRRLTLRLKRRNFQHGKARRLVHTQRLLLCSGKLDGSPSRNTRPILYIHTGFRAMTSAMRCDIQWQGARNVVCCP
jgi:hypothetical protein